MAFKMRKPNPKGISDVDSSPAKNYKNPQDYKVFNWGNKPSPVKQDDEDLVENIRSTQGTTKVDDTLYNKPEGLKVIPWSPEAEAAHLENERNLYSQEGLTADEINAALARTRHLPNPNPEPEPEIDYTTHPDDAVFPDDEKRGRKRSRSRVRRVRLPKRRVTRNLVTGGKNITRRRTGTT